MSGWMYGCAIGTAIAAITSSYNDINFTFSYVLAFGKIKKLISN